MSRRLIVMSLATALVAAIPAAAEEMNLEQVLEKHYEAIGGLDAWKKVEAVEFRGTMNMGEGAEAPFTMTQKRPDKMKIEFTFQGMTGVQAYDGETAWMIMPFLGKNDPEVMDGDQAKNMRQQSDMDGPLVDWKEKGHQVELVGVEKMEGTDTYKLKVTLKDGDVRFWYLDKDHFVPLKMEGKSTVQGQEVDFETTLGDYKEVGGLLIPHSIESKPKGAPHGQVITVSAVELAPEVSDDMFVMPKVEKPAAAAEGSG